MLWTPQNEFGYTVDNFGATITDAGFATSVNAHATNANQKGTAVSLIAGASVLQDIFGVAIVFTGGNTAASIRRFLADLLVDPAGGTAWSTLIPNLFVNNPSLLCGGYRYYFPIYIKAGSSIGCQQQCSTANIPFRCGVRLFGKPSRPELVKVGSQVEAFGVTAASTSGTALTPGNAVVGAYASMGTSVADLWWWQWGGIGTNDTTMTPQKGGFGDVAAGDATNKKICVEGCNQMVTAAEESTKEAFGLMVPIRHIKGGETVYVRASMSGAADTTPTTTAYGLGG